jgi:hypothetical protein
MNAINDEALAELKAADAEFTAAFRKYKAALAEYNAAVDKYRAVWYKYNPADVALETIRNPNFL